jgi:hypothetical protein
MSIVYTAMGMAQSKYNIQDAISSFFKRFISVGPFFSHKNGLMRFLLFLKISFQCKFKCIQSLFALCSIGLLKKDKTLINAVFKELNAISDLKFKFDIVRLKSIYFCLEVYTFSFGYLNAVCFYNKKRNLKGNVI